jgi:hypothetical protein
VFIRPDDTIADLSLLGHAGLSQNFLQQGRNLPPAHRPALDETHDHAHVLHHPGVWHRDRRHHLRRDRRRGRPALAVLLPLLSAALRPTVIFHAALRRPPPPLGLSAAKRTPQIAPTGIARMGDEEDPTVSASRQTSPQFGPGSQDRSQERVIREHQRRHDRAFAIPPRPKLETLLDRYRKKPNSPLKLKR